jgi:hypothetical protein
MGVSTDGILVFGIQLPEEETPEFLKEFDNDFETFIDSLNGLPQWGEEGHDIRKTHAFRDNFPVDLVQHCSYEYPMYILAVRGTEITARRGYPNEIDPLTLYVDSDKVETLRKFCEEYNIEWEEPKWYLCSMWG